MQQRTREMLLVFRMLTDITMVSVAWVVAYWLRFHTFLDSPLGVPQPTLYYKLIPFIVVIWFTVFAAAGFYKRTGKHRSAFLEALDIIQISILAMLCFIAFTYIYAEYRYSRLTVFIFAMTQPILVISGRSLIRKFLRRYRRLHPGRQVLIIGSGPTLKHALSLTYNSELTKHEIHSVMLVGTESEIEEARIWCQNTNLSVVPTLTDMTAWPEFLSNSQIASVVIALPHKAYDFLEHHLTAIANQIPDIRLIPDLMRYTRFASGVDIIDGTPVVTINESPLAGMGHVIKRLMDLCGATCALLLFSPIMAIIACLIPLSSRGPIFYRQERMGLDGRRFYMLKFRSMPVDAEARTGAVWATSGDNRATRLGSLLRRTSLDELPQLFNVFRGEMSLVGPRPERPVFVDEFRKNVPGYFLRHKAKAGVTGWAQVNGWRGNTSIEKRIECDLYYIQNWSVWFDIRIIILTIFRGFINKNAY